MKTFLLSIAAILLAGSFGLTAEAQTLNICEGNVTTAVTASSDEMTYAASGTTLTVLGKTFQTSDIDLMYIDDSSVSDNTVGVTYNGTEAKVVVAGNVAKYLTVEVTGAHVAIIQSADLEDEITYTLQGSSTDGSFWMDGKLKASIVLNGLTLNCADSAAINIRDGKRISIQLVDGTTNTLTDGASGDQKACFAVKGHAEFKGGGTLNLTGNAKHAFASNEYCELKKTVGAINILGAVKDGMNISQYLEMKGGTVTISGVGDDGIQVDMTDDDTDEQNGQVFIKGGTLNISVTAAAAKGLKCEDSLFVSGGTVSITTTGDGQYDSDDNDVSGAACIKVDASASITGGTLTLKSTGKGGKGLSSDADVTIDDGTLTVTTTGAQYVYNRLDTSPKGIKADGNLTINGGTITVTCSGGEGSEGLESKNEMYITGGDIIANCYDDCLNASNKISISGGRVYAVSTGNDAIDSNGTLYISGGVVIASGTREPEGSFDCDQNTFSVTGGVMIGLGGDTSTPTSSVTTQPVVITSGSSYTKGQYLALTDASGNLIWALAVPQTYSSCKLVFSAPEMSVGSSYKLYSNASVSGGTFWQGYSDDTTVGTSGSSTTISVSQMVTTSGGGGWPGGGGGGPGGGGGRH